MNLSDQLKSIAIQGAKDAGANITPSMQNLLDEANIKHSRNGDPVSHAVEALHIKLGFALQDPSVFKEITDEEIELALQEINLFKNNEVSDDDRPF